MRYGDCGDGEDALRDRFSKDRKCGGEIVVLMFAGLEQWGCGVQSLCAFGRNLESVRVIAELTAGVKARDPAKFLKHGGRGGNQCIFFVTGVC